MNRARCILSLLCAINALLAMTSPAWAHNPDTSYTKIQISPERIDFKLTFDVITLLKITQLDENKDHQVTRQELLKKTPLLEKFIHEHIKVTFDGREPAWEPGDAPVFSENLPAVKEPDYHQTLVHFVFHQEIVAVPEEISIDFKVFDTLGDRHTNLASIEEGKPATEEIIFTKFEPSYDYYTDTPTDLQRQLTQFLQLGIKHICFGYDHILFLLALIMAGKLIDLIKVITAFTVAHSITLILAALDYVTLPGRWVEAGIAATIIYVAMENLRGKSTAHRWRLAFGFGLVHGLGFASVLQKMSLPTTGLVRSLITFNVGVEIAQLGIVLLVLPLSFWLAKQPFDRRARHALSAVILLCGLVWLVERLFGVVMIRV